VEGRFNTAEGALHRTRVGDLLIPGRSTISGLVNTRIGEDVTTADYFIINRRG
jgi:hypothetical protein